MNPREQFLYDVEQALKDQTISPQDLEDLLRNSSLNSDRNHPQVSLHAEQVHSQTSEIIEDKHKNGLNAIDVLFYLAGIILFAALVTMNIQVGHDSLATRLFISLGAGLLFWAGAYLMSRQPVQSDTKRGVIHSMLLTGSLSVIAGGYILTANFTDLAGGTSDSAALIYAVALATLGIVHALLDRLLRSAVLIIFGLILFVLSFPAAITGLLTDIDVPPDVWGVVGIVTGLLFAYGGKLVSLTASGREEYKGSFESVAGFVILASIYVMGFASDIRVFWELLLPLTIYAAFFISIKRRSKQFLLTGSLFLVLFLVTISFRYFAGLGAAFSLVLSAFSILGTAFVAANINKKYITEKQ